MRMKVDAWTIDIAGLLRHDSKIIVTFHLLEGNNREINHVTVSDKYLTADVNWPLANMREIDQS